MVTSTAWECIVAPGRHWYAPQMTSWSTPVVPAGVPKVMGQPRLSNAAESHYCPFGSPMIDAPLGSALRNVPQLQLPRASRPAHRTAVIVAPGGALNECPEWLKPE
jgi:hypothetical protein